MKSYKEHLITLLDAKPTHACQRASAIFPFIISPALNTKLIFLNYWKLKRGIEKLACSFFIRDAQGQLILEKKFTVSQALTHEINLSKWLQGPYPMRGSVEIEFLSSENLVFPYPAVTALYESANGLSFVHSCQRIYNNQSDENFSKRKEVIESGFNIYANKDTFAFITLINGAHSQVAETITLSAINSKQQMIKKKLTLNAPAYGSHLISLKSWNMLRNHLDNQAGCLKIKFRENGSFSRLIVGNYSQKTQSMSVTHSYYDLSSSQKKDDYWSCQDTQWNPMSLMLPLFQNHSYSTKIFFYPIYSPCDLVVDFEIYDALGQQIFNQKEALIINQSTGYQHIDLANYVDLSHLSIPVLIRMIARARDGSKIPARLKIGYDVSPNKAGLSCNVCTNFQPANPSLEKKKSAFRWAPLMPQKQKGCIWILNDSPRKNYTQKARVRCSIYRSADEQTISKQFSIEPHGCYVVSHDQDIAAFLKDEIGWCSFESENPNISTYYFSFSPNGNVGADHGF